MLSIPSRRRLSFVLFFAAGVESVLGQDQPGRYDILRGTDGQNSCALKDTIHSSCSTSPSPPLNVTPTATICTCNNIFFNIWSACSYASGNNTLPVYRLWLATCTNNSIDLSKSAAMQPSGLGIAIPMWASLPVPGNTSFDLQQAVVLGAHLAPKPWSMLQIVLPVITAVVAIILTLFSLFFYQRKLTTVRWKAEMKNIIHRNHRVRPVAPPSTGQWEIEPQEAPPSQELHEQYEFVQHPSPAETVPDTIPGHPSRYSESFGGSLARGSLSNGRVYPFSPEAHAAFQAPRIAPMRNPSDPNSTSTSSTHRSMWQSVHIPNPFKRRIHRLNPKPPHRGFNIDQSTDASSSKRSTVATSTNTGARTTFRTSIEPIDEAMEGSEVYYTGSQDNEHTNLITDEERASSIAHGTEEYTTGTRSGHSSTVNSHIQIISPSISTSSPASAKGPRTTSGFSFPRPVIFVPPVPNKPAPSPPSAALRISPRGREGASGPNALGPPYNQIIPTSERTMSPIQEDQYSDISGHTRHEAPSVSIPLSTTGQSPSPARTFSGSSSEQRRPLPSPASSSGLSRTEYSPPHQRSASHPLSSLSGPMSRQFNDSTSSVRSASYDQVWPHAPGRTRTPLAEVSRPLHSTSESPPGQLPSSYFNARQRSGSNHLGSSGQAFSSQDLYDDPFMPSASHRRGLSADDTASFYLTPEPVQPVRSTTPSSSRSNPSVFFPGAVRGAGYGGVP